jgi:hypothetical protein
VYRDYDSASCAGNPDNILGLSKYKRTGYISNLVNQAKTVMLESNAPTVFDEENAPGLAVERTNPIVGSEELAQDEVMHQGGTQASAHGDLGEKER